MEYAILLVTLSGIVLFWGMLKRTIKIGEEMSLRGLEKLNDEQKIISVKFYERIDTDAEAVATAKANKKMLDSLDI